jgi:hypothetical protein
MNTWVPLRKGSEMYASLPTWVRNSDRDKGKRMAALEKARSLQQTTSLEGPMEEGLDQLMAALVPSKR